MNNATKGVIYFSFGTFVKCDDIPKANKDIILNTFKELPNYSFFWKCESTDVSRRPAPNVWVQNFYPQNDIFAHPKLVGFVSHSGMLSTQEATWYGIPMLGIPFIVDQRSVSCTRLNLNESDLIDFLSF